MEKRSNQDSSLLEAGLGKIGIGSEEPVFSLLEKYIDEIELFNSAYGLVKVKDRRELIVKHIFDSLAPIKIFHDLSMSQKCTLEKQFRIADIGSGAGLPGIPLSICIREAEFTLVERMKRRAGFLMDAVAVLGLSNVTVEETEMEELSANQSFSGLFDIITFRAWKPLSPSILNGLLPLLKPGGTIAAYKGRRESIEEEISQFLLAKGNSTGALFGKAETIPLEVPFLNEERHLVLLSKS